MDADRGLGERQTQLQGGTTLHSTPTQFIPALNGLRAIAALAVFAHHASQNGLLPTVFQQARAGQLGVMLFFCLSGLLMAELYIRQDATWASVRNFVCARFARIFPLFAVVVVGSALIYHFDTRFPFQLDAVAATKHLLLFGDGLTMWSISVEFQFYAAFVGLWLLYAALPKRHRNIGLALVCIGLVLALWMAGYPGERIAITHYGQFFLVGVLAAIILWHAPATAGTGRAASFVLPLLLAFDVLAAVILRPSDYDCYRSLPLLILAGTIVLAGAGGKGFFAERVLGSQLMVYLGDVSFGVYLLHRPVLYFWQNLIGIDLHSKAMFLIAMATLLATSHLAYRWIEQPMRHALSPNAVRSSTAKYYSPSSFASSRREHLEAKANIPTGNILVGRQAGNQIEKLEDKSNVLSAIGRKVSIAQRGQFNVFET
jgi:peptidoglycan/LPS O-acetylase OafA/YrhL